jgi:tetratricopeptide (TPR) repeat protein
MQDKMSVLCLISSFALAGALTFDSAASAQRGSAPNLSQRTPPAQDEDAEYHYRVGVVALKDGNLDIALREFSTAARMEPENALIQYNLAIVNQKKGRPADALRSLREAMRLGLPDDVSRAAKELLPSLAYENEKTLEAGRSLRDAQGFVMYPVCGVAFYYENSHFEGDGCDLTLVIETKTNGRSTFQRTPRVPARLRNVEKVRMDPRGCNDGESLGHYFGFELTLAGESSASRPTVYFRSPAESDSALDALEKVAASCKASR